MDEMKIDKDIPMPQHLSRNVKYPFGTLEIGDSFLVNESRRLVSSAACAFGKNHNKKFTVRTTPEGMRCWRVK